MQVSSHAFFRAGSQWAPLQSLIASADPDEADAESEDDEEEDDATLIRLPEAEPSDDED